MAERKFIIKVKSLDKVEELLQETYDLACQQINQIQNEITKITNTTILANLDIDGKAKYGKVINDYLANLQKAINQKFEIAKFLGEIEKSNGDVAKALENTDIRKSSINLKKLRESIKEATDTGNVEPDKYNITTY